MFKTIASINCPILETFNTAIRQLQQTRRSTISPLLQAQKMAFSGGPYNPLAFKSHLVPEELPT